MESNPGPAVPQTFAQTTRPLLHGQRAIDQDNFINSHSVRKVGFDLVQKLRFKGSLLGDNTVRVFVIEVLIECKPEPELELFSDPLKAQ